MHSEEPTLTRVKNGWHYGSRSRNLTVWGATEEEARRLYAAAVEKAEKIRARPDLPSAG
jgi:hypothetical protein